MITDKKLLARLTKLGHAKYYSVRHAQALIELEGFERPSLDFIWRFFRTLRSKRIKKIR